MPSKKPDNRSTHERMRALLLEYALTADIKKAAKRAGIARSVHYKWLKKPMYAKAFHATRQQAGEALEAIAVERASVGWEEDVFYQGAKCGTVTRYDSGLMQLLLKGFLPEKYGNKTEISGPQGAPVQARIEIVFVRPGDVTGSGGTDAGLAQQ